MGIADIANEMNGGRRSLDPSGANPDRSSASLARVRENLDSTPLQASSPMNAPSLRITSNGREYVFNALTLAVWGIMLADILLVAILFKVM